MMSAAGRGLDEAPSAPAPPGLVVDDDAVADEAVVAVGVVRVERDVGDDADLRHRVLDRAGGAADEVVGVPGLGGLAGSCRPPRCRGRARGRGCRARPPPPPPGRRGRSTGGRRRASRRSARRRPSPSRTKIGQIRSAAPSRVSRDHRADPRACGAGGAAGSAGRGQAVSSCVSSGTSAPWHASGRVSSGKRMTVGPLVVRAATWPPPPASSF